MSLSASKQYRKRLRHGMIQHCICPVPASASCILRIQFMVAAIAELPCPLYIKGPEFDIRVFEDIHPPVAADASFICILLILRILFLRLHLSCPPRDPHHPYLLYHLQSHCVLRLQSHRVLCLQSYPCPVSAIAPRPASAIASSPASPNRTVCSRRPIVTRTTA